MIVTRNNVYEQSRPGIIMAITSSNKAVITIGMKAHSIVDLPQRKGLYGGFFATIEDAMPGVETRLRDARRHLFLPLSRFFRLLVHGTRYYVVSELYRRLVGSLRGCFC